MANDADLLLAGEDDDDMDSALMFSDADLRQLESDLLGDQNTASCDDTLSLDDINRITHMEAVGGRTSASRELYSLHTEYLCYYRKFIRERETEAANRHVPAMNVQDAMGRKRSSTTIELDKNLTKILETLHAENVIDQPPNQVPHKSDSGMIQCRTVHELIYAARCGDTYGDLRNVNTSDYEYASVTAVIVEEGFTLPTELQAAIIRFLPNIQSIVYAGDPGQARPIDPGAPARSLLECLQASGAAPLTNEQPQRYFSPLTVNHRVDKNSRDMIKFQHHVREGMFARDIYSGIPTINAAGAKNMESWAHVDCPDEQSLSQTLCDVFDALGKNTCFTSYRNADVDFINAVIFRHCFPDRGLSSSQLKLPSVVERMRRGGGYTSSGSCGQILPGVPVVITEKTWSGGQVFTNGYRDVVARVFLQEEKKTQKTLAGGQKQSVMVHTYVPVDGVSMSSWNKTVLVLQSGRCAFLRDFGLTVIKLAYAMTIHKMQGSQEDNIVLVIPPSPARLGGFHRRLVYTGVTRARKKLVIVGPWANFAECVKQDDPGGRMVALTSKLKFYLQNHRDVFNAEQCKFLRD